MRPRDALIVFDGRGAEYDAIVEHISGDRVGVRVGAPRAAAPEPGVAVTLAQAVLKGDKMDDVVRDAVMMGVAAIQPIVTARTETSPSVLLRAHRRERWERIAVSSAKQCARAVVPPILDPMGVDAVPAAIGALHLPVPAFLFVEPGASPDTAALGGIEPTTPRQATLIVGPEGGWTADEIGRLAAAARPVTMGARTIRADAMAVVAMAALFARWREF